MTSSDVVLHLAMAVARPHSDAFFVNADNTRGDYIDVGTAAHSGKAFCVQLRNGLVALDIDFDGKAGEAPDWLAEADFWLRDIGSAIVRVQSGRHGHEHLFAFSPIGWTSAELKDHLVEQLGVPAGQVRWGNSPVRPPLSPHRQGREVRLLEPRSTAEAIDLLRRRPRSTPLKSKWLRLINQGVAPDPHYLTADGELRRTSVTYGLAMAYVNADLEWTEFRANVSNCPPLREKLGERGDSWLTDQWEKARKKVRDTPSGAAPSASDGAVLDAAFRVLAYGQWSGVAGGTDRRVYGQLVQLASAWGRTTISRSVRTLALDVGVNRSTVSRSLHRLTNAGLVETVERAGLYRAATYRLLDQNDSPSGQLPISKGGIVYLSRSAVVSPELPDAWRTREGLPPASHRTWSALSRDRPMKTAELAKLLGSKPRTVRNHLLRLHEVGLVVRPTAQTWLAVEKSEADLNALAEQLGTRGATAAQREQHDLEREWVDKVRIAKGWDSREQADGRRLQAEASRRSNSSPGRLPA